MKNQIPRHRLAAARSRSRLLVSVGCLLAWLLTGCSVWTVEPTSPLASEAEIEFVLPADAEQCFELYGDSKACLAYLRQACENQEFLIMVTSAFTQALRNRDVELTEPQTLDQQLDFSEDEQITVSAVRAAFDDIFSAEAISSGATTIEFGSWQGYGSELYIFRRHTEAESVTEATADESPERYGLMSVPVCVDGHPVMVVTHTYSDGTKESGYFDLHTGFQRIMSTGNIS